MKSLIKLLLIQTTVPGTYSKYIDFFSQKYLYQMLVVIVSFCVPSKYTTSSPSSLKYEMH